MADDILLKVRLDTSGARADLKSLYGDMARAPRTSITGPGVGPGGLSSVGGAGEGGGGGGFGGGMLAKILGGLSAAVLMRDTISSAGTIGGALTGGISSRMEQMLLGDTAPGVRGAQRAAGETSSQLGLARGLGLVSDSSANSLFEALRPLREAEEKGKRELDVMFKGTIASDTAEGLLGKLVDLGMQIEKALRDIQPWN